MTIEAKISYKKIVAGFKVEEITTEMADGEFRKRFTVEFENPLWPFGFENYKTAKPDGSVSITFKLLSFLFCHFILTLNTF